MPQMTHFEKYRFVAEVTFKKRQKETPYGKTMDIISDIDDTESKSQEQITSYKEILRGNVHTKRKST